MGDFIELKKFVGAFMRMWWLIVLVTICAGLLGYLYSKNQTPIYRATATLIIGQSMQSPDLSRNEIQTSQELALTYADIAKRFPVLDGAVKALGIEMDWRVLRNSIDVILVPNTQLLEITATEPSPMLAEAFANEVARQLILFSPSDLSDQRTAETQVFVNERLESLQKKIVDGEERLQRLEALDFTELSADSIVRTEEEIATLEQLITGWEANYSTLLGSMQTTSDSVNYLEVIEPAMASLSPIRPRTMLNTMVALIVGAILAIGLVILADHMDDSIHASSEVSQGFDIPLLGSIAQLPGKSKDGILASRQEMYSRTAEDYRLLRSRLLLQNPNKEGTKSFLIASPEHGQGCSATVTNLGIAMAQAGLQTIIVDADLRHPKQHELLAVDNDRGLINLLCYPDMSIDGLLKKCPQSPNLLLLNAGILWEEQIFTGGSLFLTPTELLGAENMKRVLSQLHQRADVILIDGPPAVPYADTSIISTLVDGVVVVVGLNHTGHSEIGQALANLRQAGATIIGTVTKKWGRWQASGLMPFQLPQAIRRSEKDKPGSQTAIEAKT